MTARDGDQNRGSRPRRTVRAAGPDRGVGNYQVTAHRTTKPAPFRDLPALVEGDVAHVDAGGVRYTYRVTATRKTSFRSPTSLAEQRAAVPGRPGVEPTQAMITLSTCLTPEDHAAGNHPVRQPGASRRQDRCPRRDRTRPGLASRTPLVVLGSTDELVLWRRRG